MDNNSRRFYINEQTDSSPDTSYNESLETPAAGMQQLTASTSTQPLNQHHYQYLSGTPASRIAAAAVGRRLDLGAAAAARPPQFALHQPPSSFRGSNAAGSGIEDESAFGDSAFTTPVMDYHRRADQAAAGADRHSGLLGTGTSDLRSYGYWDETPSEATNHSNKPAPSLPSIEQQQQFEEEHSGFWGGSIDSPQDQHQQHNDSIAQQVADGPPTPFGNQSNAAVDEDFMLNLNQEGDLERLTRKAMNDANGAWKQLTMDILRKQLASLDEDEWMYVSDCR
ncbi:hypothetical protein H4R20_004823 [Coemansia guatemalensis]|uniref:Uncharacterized protein n=1 Tax=Coemansia guatemalensis TaxID=2761395 RepID=A0A9W8HTX6_9FUNG|nr:hypothetical protein H4R20_004823 [Coemansia guatemalensis]